MPNPAFMPVIGSGFDQVAGQQMQWANFNRGVEEANLARLAAAQQAANQWQAQQQSLAESALERQQRMAYNQQQAAQSAWAQAQQAGEGRREFDVGAALRREEIQAAKDLNDAKVQEARRQERERLSAIQNLGDTLGKDVQPTRESFDAATTAKDDAEFKLQTARADVEKQYGALIQFDHLTKEFRARAGTGPEGEKAAADANTAISEAKANSLKAENAYKIRLGEWSHFQDQANKAGFAVRPHESGNWVLFHPELGKTFGVTTKRAQPEQSTPQSGLRVITFDEPPDWAKASGTTTATTPVQAGGPNRIFPSGFPAGTFVSPPAISTPDSPPPMGDPNNPLSPSWNAYDRAGMQPTRVRVRAPNGQTGTISSDKLAAALAAGYTQIR